MSSIWTRRGGLAFLISVLLHALLLAGLRQLPGGEPVHASQQAPGLFMILDEDDSNEEQEPQSYLSQPTPLSQRTPAHAEEARPKVVPSAIGLGHPPLNPGEVRFPSQPFPLGTTGATGATGTGSSGASPGPGATFVGLPVRGQRIVFVIDRSASMGLNGALEQAARALRASVDEMTLDALFQVFVYHRHAEPILRGAPVWLSPTSEIKQNVAEALANLRAEGGTDHLPALRRALALRPDVVFFLTDADDLPADLPREIARLNNGHAVIHTIELTLAHRDQPHMPMQALARENRGMYQAVNLLPTH